MKTELILAATLLAQAACGALCVKDGETVAFLGDSITFYGSQNDGHVDLVKRAFEAAGLTVGTIEVGVPGHESGDMLARVDREVLRRRPRWMTVMAGVNDVAHLVRGQGNPTLEKYRKNMTELFDRCAASNVNVIVFTATMFERAGETEKIRENVLQKSYNGWLRAEAARRGLPVADVNAVMWEAWTAERPKGGRLHTVDGIHMNRRGEFMLARTLLRAMGLSEAELADVEARAWKPVWVFRELVLKDGADRAACLDKARALIEAVRKEPGCRECRLLGDFRTAWDKPARLGGRSLRLMEKWASILALGKHVDGKTFRDVAPGFDAFFERRPFHVLEDVLPDGGWCRGNGRKGM